MSRRMYERFIYFKNILKVNKNAYMKLTQFSQSYVVSYSLEHQILAQSPNVVLNAISAFSDTSK